VRLFWIDTDTASDDAVALLMAFRAPEVKVVGVSIVSGNVPVEMGARNAGYAAELAGVEVPVYLGLPRPLLREAIYAYFFHGPDGMGGMNYPAPKRAPESRHAVEALIGAVRAAPGQLTLVTLGPLTNIATAIRLAPDLVEKIPMTYVMGGAAATLGNITPAAEYNIWVDPEAARMVIPSGLPLLLVGWEHCRGAANLDDREMAELRAFGTPFADFALDCNRQAIRTNREWLGDPGLSLPDPVTMAIALDPSLCTRRGRHFVDVECDSELTRGMTVVDQAGVLRQTPNAEVCWAIDVRGWKASLYRSLR